MSLVTVEWELLTVSVFSILWLSPQEGEFISPRAMNEEWQVMAVFTAQVSLVIGTWV